LLDSWPLVEPEDSLPELVVEGELEELCDSLAVEVFAVEVLDASVAACVAALARLAVLVFVAAAWVLREPALLVVVAARLAVSRVCLLADADRAGSWPEASCA
jgi:hypothetical protein